MKKLIIVMVGLGLTFGTVAAFAAQDAPKKEETGKKAGKKKGGKKKEDTTKKQG